MLCLEKRGHAYQDIGRSMTPIDLIQHDLTGWGWERKDGRETERGNFDMRGRRGGGGDQRGLGENEEKEAEVMEGEEKHRR